MNILYFTRNATTHPAFHPLFEQAVRQVADLTIVRNGEALPVPQQLDIIRQYDVMLLMRDTVSLPPELARTPGRLRYVCCAFGSLAGVVGPEIIDSPILVTNYGDAAAQGLAEGALALLLATLKDLRHRIAVIKRGGFGVDPVTHGGWVEGLNVGVYGCGAIGRRFLELLRPFRATVRVFDPYLTECPPGVTRVSSLEELFANSQAIVIHAGLSAETRGSVTAALLAKLPRHGVVINTARGAIIDQTALFAELASGRLRAGLDVLDPEELPAGHPARHWENCLITGHQIHQGWPTPPDAVPTRLDAVDEICLENLRRWRDGQPLRGRITPTILRRMT